MHKNRLTNIPAASLAVLACFLTTGSARSEQPRLLWQDTVDGSNFDQAFDVAALNDGVFVAGFVGVADGGRDFLVRAYNARNGTLRWQDRVDNGPNDFASGVVAAGKTVFVSGAVGSRCCPDWLVRAHDAETGRLLWQDRFDLAGGPDSPRPGALAVSEGLLFVVGSASNYSVWVVRAYDTANGTLVWQNQFVQGPGFNGAESLVVQRGRVFVGGFGSTNLSDDVIIRAHDAQTGSLLWQHRTSGPKSCCTTMRGLGSDGTRVFAGGTVANPSGKHDFLVLALDAQSGMLVWEDRVDNRGDYDAANGIAVRGRQVFAQGHGGPRCLFGDSPPSDCDVLIRSYDAKTGALLWAVKAGTAGIDDSAPPQVILAHAGMLFGAWEVNLPTVGPKGDWLVQAYQRSTGQLLWEDRLDTRGGSRFEGSELPFGVAFLRGRLFVVGRTVDAADNWNFVVRAYYVGGEKSDEVDDISDNRVDEQRF